MPGTILGTSNLFLICSGKLDRKNNLGRVYLNFQSILTCMLYLLHGHCYCSQLVLSAGVMTGRCPLCFSVAFHRCVQSNIVLLTQAFRRKFVIPDFMSFTSHIDELYESAKKQSGGKVRVGFTFPNINIWCKGNNLDILFTS